MPGLIRGVARTAVIAGTATSVSNRVSRRQAGRWAAQEAQQAPPPAPAPQPVYAVPAPAAAPAGVDMDTKLAQVRELGEMRAQGLLTDAEFEVQKSRILAG
ncbi:SHOCT domain-containing protein [Cellulomonas soli]|uniref:SHOCT domain-containing protein n=1 Tax=Cellulomonas soli TaxID=931535 RepID=UPI003F82C541